MLDNSIESASPFFDKPTVNDHPIHELLRNRWSPRAFAPRPVESEKLLSLFEAARWSPSSANSQPWSFIVTEHDDSGAFARLVDTLTGNNLVWARQVPVLVLTITKREYKPGRDNFWAAYDLGQAVAHLTVQACALGLVVHQMGGFDRAKALAAFNIPAGYDAVTVIAIGYHGDLNNLPETLREREREARTRKLLNEFVFEESWNQPFKSDVNQTGSL